jgi:hypothetical protein
VNPAEGWKLPSPATVAVPTNVPPGEHVFGAVGCGPNTVKVIVPDADAPPLTAADSDDAAIAWCAAPCAGTDSDSDGAALTTVSAIDAPHADDVELLFASPP